MRKGNMTILASILAIILVAIGVGAGTMAYFSDTETSSGNQFTAGTIDLTLGAMTGVSFPLSNMKPGDIISGSVTVQNTGTLAGKLYGRTTYTEADATPNPSPDKTADEFADKLKVTSWEDPTMTGPVNPAMILKALALQTGVAVSTFSGTWMPYGTLASSASGTFDMTIEFDTAAGNDYQGDGIAVKFEYLLVQTNHPTTP